MISHIGHVFVASVLAAVARGQAITAGPVAPVSLYERIEWATARSCAAACLRYNGVWNCGNHAGYWDVGMEIECGCNSINGCYCNTELASSASSYISACVSSRCSAVDDLTRDLSKMIGLYDSYCETARAEGAEANENESENENAPRPNDDEQKTAAETTDETTVRKTSGSGAIFPSQTSSSGAESTTTGEGAEASSNNNSNNGLSRSDIVALAASLGVGIPSLLIAALTLYFQIRKKRRAAEATARTNSMVHVMPVKQARHDWDFR